MNKFDTKSPIYIVSPASGPDLMPASRLIVLVPDSELDTALAARKIREAAKAMESRVQLLGLSRDAAHEPGVRRQLITLAAMVADPAIFVESKIEYGKDWLNAVRFHWHRGDVIVCFSEQLSGPSGRSLSRILESNLNAPVYVIAGAGVEKKSPHPNWLYNALAWIGSIALILGFFWIQVQLTRSPRISSGTSLLYISLFAEAGSIWFWNNLFNRRAGK